MSISALANKLKKIQNQLLKKGFRLEQSDLEKEEYERIMNMPSSNAEEATDKYFALLKLSNDKFVHDRYLRSDVKVSEEESERAYKAFKNGELHKLD